MMSVSDKHILVSSDDYVWSVPNEKTVPEYLLRRISEHVKDGRKHCITNAVDGFTLNYDDVESLSKNVASGLYKLGVRKGDTVIYSSHDAARIHTFCIGIWRANGIVRSSYPEDFDGTLLERIKESKARWIACDVHYAKENLETASKVSWLVQVIVFGEFEGCISVDTLFSDVGDACPKLDVTAEDPAMILPTSGTTGNSKGVLYKHKSLIENILVYENLPFTDKPEEPTIITSKQTHYIGSITALAFISRGRRLIMMPSVTVENIFRAVSEYKVLAILGFPKYLTALVNDPTSKNYDLTSLRYLSTAGQLVVPEVVTTINKLPNLKAFMVFYGMTECGLLTSWADWKALSNGFFKSLDENRPFSVGKLPPFTSLKVRDVETGEILGPKKQGELCIKSPLTCDGYLDKPKEVVFQNGWIRTGDVGYYDEDGYVYIVDRLKEIFKYFNNHISPSELESVLLRHPSVSDAVCCGVPDPDGGDFIPRAFVVLRENHKTTVEEIRKFYEGQVASYKKLRGGLFMLPQIPVGKTGKVTRKIMAELPVQ